jgi:hypothetical protein
MGAKLNFKTYLQNRFLNFFSHLSEGPDSYDCTKTLVIYILLSLCGYMCLLRHTFTTSLGQITTKCLLQKIHILQLEYLIAQWVAGNSSSGGNSAYERIWKSKQSEEN